MIRYLFLLVVLTGACTEEDASSATIANLSELWKVKPCQSIETDGDGSSITYNWTYENGNVKRIVSEDGKSTRDFSWENGFPKTVKVVMPDTDDVSETYSFDDTGAMTQLILTNMKGETVQTTKFFWPKDSASHGKTLATNEYLQSTKFGNVDFEALLTTTRDADGRVISERSKQLSTDHEVNFTVSYDEQSRVTNVKGVNVKDNTTTNSIVYKYTCEQAS